MAPDLTASAGVQPHAFSTREGKTKQVTTSIINCQGLNVLWSGFGKLESKQVLPWKLTVGTFKNKHVNMIYIIYALLCFVCLLISGRTLKCDKCWDIHVKSQAFNCIMPLKTKVYYYITYSLPMFNVFFIYFIFLHLFAIILIIVIWWFHDLKADL